MEVCPASSPRSPGVVCYSRSPGSPPSPTLGSPDTGHPAAVDPDWVSQTPPAPRSRPREGASLLVAARQSARISKSWILQDGRIPTIPDLAARRAVARDLFPVAADSGIVFRGEKGSPLEQISALCAKERLEGALAEARILAARADPPAPRMHSVPGHREIRYGGAPSVTGGIVTPMAGLPYVQQPRGALPPVLTPQRPAAR
ncbi:hypothetical protein ZWY2020_040008 [Hordeum vulgare]|nr:hypothetical protein ZWY2020_040008 [Hordeum vulgare]